MKNHLKKIAQGSLEVVNSTLADASKKQEILDKSFQDALQGIRAGKMTYEKDPLLPLLQEEMNRRISEFKGLSSDEEGRLLALTPDQRRIIADQDRKTKNDYLGQAASINNAGVKAHEKYRRFQEAVNNIHKGDVKAH